MTTHGLARRLGLMASTLLAAGLLAGSGLLADSGHTHTTRVLQESEPTTTSTSIPPYCLSSLPGFKLSVCLAEDKALRAQTEKQWPSTGPMLSETAVKELVANVPSSGLGPDRPSARQVIAVYPYETTYGNADSLLGNPNSMIQPSTPVWIVSVRYRQPANPALVPGIVYRAPGLPGPPAPYYSTFMVDAVTGNPITGCSGCEVVKPDGTLIHFAAITRAMDKSLEEAEAHDATPESLASLVQAAYKQLSGSN